LSFATVAGVMRSIIANLSAGPLGRQDRTLSPSASVPLVNRHSSVHRIPLHVRDDRDAPLSIGTERQE
jgi:hypothetical protein